MAIRNKSEEIAEILKQQINSGLLAGKLPSEQELAMEFKTARMTAAKALNLLREANLAERIPGRGSFVKAVRKRLLKIYGFPESFRRLCEFIEKRFPGVEIQYTREPDEADLMVFTTTPPFNYSDRLLPWPRARAERMRSEGRIFEPLLEVHTREEVCYGVPFLFSPILTAYNREMMRRLAPDFSPYDLSWEQFGRLIKAGGIEWHGWALAYFVGALTDCSLDGVCVALRHFEELSPLPLDRKLDFLSGKALFRPVTRHGLSELRGRKKEFDIMPSPLLNGSRRCMVASETLFVTHRMADPELGFDICEATLSPEFGAFITADRHGICADRGKAFESLDSRYYRDDIFFNEIRSLALDYCRIDFSVRIGLYMDFRALCQGTRDRETLIANAARNLQKVADQRRESVHFLNISREPGWAQGV